MSAIQMTCPVCGGVYFAGMVGGTSWPPHECPVRAALADAAEYLRLAWTWTADTDRHEKLRQAHERAVAALSDHRATPDEPGEGRNDG